MDNNIIKSKTTTNSIGNIVSGSKVKIGSQLYEVGEIVNKEACLYQNNKLKKKEKIEKLKAI